MHLKLRAEDVLQRTEKDSERLIKIWMIRITNLSNNDVQQISIR